MCVVWHIINMARKPESVSRVEAWFWEQESKLWPVALGSLSLRRTRCIRKHCHACESGEQHPSYVVYGRHRGRRFGLYISDALVPEVRRAVAHGRAFQELLMETGLRYLRALKDERRRAG
jgi:hypothetical protein